jgi:Fis family transcriptional regulator
MSSNNLAVLEINGELTPSCPPASLHPPLHQVVKKALEDYLSHLEDQNPVNLYDLVLNQIEAPLLEVVMKLTKNNQSQAAILLGLSRGTLRKKLKQYNLDHS